MFCKLFKHDTKELFQKVWLMYFFILVTALLVRGCSMLAETATFLGYVATGGKILLIIASVIIFIWAFLTGIRHFYRKMLTDEGYLTNTIPAKSSTILTAKTLSMLLMMVVTIAVIALGIVIAMYKQETWGAFWEMAKLSFEEGGFDLPYFLTFILSISGFSILTIQLAIQCSLVMGHSFSQNKMGCSIGFCFAFYVAYQILNVLGLGLMVLFQPNLLELTNMEALPSEVITPVFGILLTTLSIISVTSIVLTHYFTKNKLNLE